MSKSRLWKWVIGILVGTVILMQGVKPLYESVKETWTTYFPPAAESTET